MRCWMIIKNGTLWRICPYRSWPFSVIRRKIGMITWHSCNYLLTERSISSTAKIMHMHRNSVIYRLNKIQEILGLDLNDPDVRLRLLISFKILELQSGHIQPAPAIEAPSNGAISFYE